MKKITVLLFALLAGAFAMQAIDKAPMRATIYPTLPDAYTQLDDSRIYYSIGDRYFAGVNRLFTTSGPGQQNAISILGEIDGQYYSCTYGSTQRDDGCGSGFLGAFKVGSYDAVYLHSKNGTTSHGVTMTAAIEAVGEVAARIVYTLTNNNDQAVTVSAGVYADIMIGNNDNAPLYEMKDEQKRVYGMKMKESIADDAPLFCALFGEDVTGVTAADDHWFGHFDHNFEPDQICGDYSNIIIDRIGTWFDRVDDNYMEEGGNYDCGIGFCWKNRTIPAGGSIELSYIISVGEIEFEEPIEPGEDRFEYQVEAIDFDGWNDLTVEHPARVWGYYEHPYGQTGYIEYQVDDENTWHRIPTELISGEEFDLRFNMMFNENRATDHVLALRFTDGLGHYTDMDGLSWTDVRSFDVSSFNEEREYNGEPQVYEIVAMGVTQTYIGETNPGTYNFLIEGVFEDNTIGIVEIEYTIDKGTPIIDVTSPAPLIDIETMAPGASTATVDVIKGDGTPIITYLNTVTGDILTEAPTAVGVYTVIVEMPETNLYYGIPATPYGTFEIYRKVTAVNEITVNGKDNGAWYTIDGRRVAAPTERGIYIHNGKKFMVK